MHLGVKSQVQRLSISLIQYKVYKTLRESRLTLFISVQQLSATLSISLIQYKVYKNLGESLKPRCISV